MDTYDTCGGYILPNPKDTSNLAHDTWIAQNTAIDSDVFTTAGKHILTLIPASDHKLSTSVIVGTRYDSDVTDAVVKYRENINAIIRMIDPTTPTNSYSTVI